jgi:hypothetical protein
MSTGQPTESNFNFDLKPSFNIVIVYLFVHNDDIEGQMMEVKGPGRSREILPRVRLEPRYFV